MICGCNKLTITKKRKKEKEKKGETYIHYLSYSTLGSLTEFKNLITLINKIRIILFFQKTI